MRAWLRSLARASLTPKGFSSGPSIQSSISGRLSSSTADVGIIRDKNSNKRTSHAHTAKMQANSGVTSQTGGKPKTPGARFGAEHNTHVQHASPPPALLYHYCIVSPKNRATGPPFPIFCDKLNLEPCCFTAVLLRLYRPNHGWARTCGFSRDGSHVLQDVRNIGLHEQGAPRPQVLLDARYKPRL